MKLTVDGREVEVAEGASVLDAARALGINIPTLCHLPGKPAQTACLVCVVRIDEGRRLLPACATRARAGMRVDSSSPVVRAARRTALELLLGYHYGDCLAACENICPTHYDVPELLRLAKTWRLDEAMTVMLERAALPGVLARVCPAPCERGCRRTQADGAVMVRAVERLVADADLAAGCPLPTCQSDSGRRVAVVGAGPAGLAAAFHLRRLGHACSLHDAAPLAGGELRQLDETVLPAAVLEAEIGRVLRLGVVFHGGVEPNPAELRLDHDAVLLAPWHGRSARGDETWHGRLARGDDGCTGGTPVPHHDIVQAIAAGYDQAIAVDRSLSGNEAPTKGRAWSVHLGKVPTTDLQTMIAACPPPGSGMDEAARCLACSCSSRHDCALRRYGEEYGAEPGRFRSPLPPLRRDDSHPLVSYEPGKCIACGLCVVVAAEHGERLGVGFAGRGYTVQVAVPLGGSLREALATSAAACAAACPTGAIALKEPAC